MFCFFGRRWAKGWWIQFWFTVAKENRANALLKATVQMHATITRPRCLPENPEPKPKLEPFSEKLNRVIYLSGFRFNTFIETLILEVKSKVDSK